MLFCVIKNCKNSQGSVKLDPSKKISFHSFPTNNETLSAWIKIVRKSLKQNYWEPSRASVICSEHFDQDKLYDISSGSRKIRKGTLPTKCLSISPTASSADEDEVCKTEDLMEDCNNDNFNDSSFESDDSEDLLTKKNKKKLKENTAGSGQIYGNVEFANLSSNIEDDSDTIHLNKNGGLIQVKTEPITKLRASGFYITHMYIGEESNDNDGEKSNKKNKKNSSSKKRDISLSDEASSTSDADSTNDTLSEYALKKLIRKKNEFIKKKCKTITSLKKQIKQLKSSKRELSETVRSLKMKKCKCLVNSKSNIDSASASDIKSESSDDVDFEV